MSQLISAARTNYFRVRNPKAFKHHMTELCLEILTKEVANENQTTHTEYALIAGEDGWYMYDDETMEEIDFGDILEEHLEPGSVALLYEVGYDSKMRSVYGWVRAITPGKEHLSIDLQNINDMVKEKWGMDVPPWP